MNKSATATMSAIFRDYLVVDENKQSYFLCDLCDFSCEAFPDVFAHHYKTEHPKANLCQNFRNENDDPLRKFAIEKNGVTSYRCDRCQMSCISRNVFIKHYAEHGDQTLQSNTVMIEFNDDKFRCSVCKKTYVHLRAAKRHLKRVHSEKKYQCNVCQKAFTYEHKAREHEKRHLKIKPFMCDICGNRFVDKLYLQKHKDKNLCSKYTCVSCNKNFRNKASLQHHMLLCEVDRQKENCPANIPSAAKNESVPQKQNQLSKEALWMKYECAKCEKKFKSKRMLRIHIVEEFNLSPYKCFICDQRFRTTVMLKEHLNLCNKSILDGNHCEDFSFTNNGNNSFGCKLCGRTFRKIGYLRQHFRLHSSSKPYVCPLCGKSYALKASFQSHMLTETNLRKFVCSKCGKRYNSSSHLTAHIKKHHRSREFKCNACDKEFAYEGDLKKHEKTHEEIKSFFCDKCGGFFKTKRCLEVHWERCSLLKK